MLCVAFHQWKLQTGYRIGRGRTHCCNSPSLVGKVVLVAKHPVVIPVSLKVMFLKPEIQYQLLLQLYLTLKSASIWKCVGPVCILKSPPRCHAVKSRHFELLLRDAPLIWTPVGEEFSAFVWDRCQPSIARNLCNY